MSTRIISVVITNRMAAEAILIIFSYIHQIVHYYYHASPTPLKNHLHLVTTILSLLSDAFHCFNVEKM